MPSLRIHLLGDFLVLAEGQPVVGLHQVRLQSLLAYLLLHRHAPQSRQHLAFLFWPDSTEVQARTNLRKALHQIRRVLPNADHYVQSDANTVQWLPNAPLALDVADFAQALSQADGAQQQERPTEVIAYLTKAVELYRGALLPACYDDWVFPERERLHAAALAALERLLPVLEEARHYTAAIRHGQQLLSLDPVHEATYRRLMQLHLLNGDRTGALRVYQTCVERLQRELGVTPTADTQVLYARLLQQERSAPQPLRIAHHPASPPLVGRQAEWRQLQQAWHRAVGGRAHFVLITGEAGIGKTRLVEEVRAWVTHQGGATLHARSYAAEGGLAYAPVIDWLRSDPLPRAVEQLAAIWRSELARLLPELLTQDPTLPRPEPLTERWQRQRLFDALTRAMLLAPSPLLLALDDLQWCDSETLEWLHFLLRTVDEQQAAERTQARLLVVGTARAEEIDAQHPLTTLRLALQRTEQISEITLGPLDDAETAMLAAQVAERTLDRDTMQHLWQASEGNPLFVVEMVRMEGSQATPAAAPATATALLPPKVHAVIQFRLDQLSPRSSKLVTLAATIGRSFTLAVLALAGDLDEGALAQALDELWQRRIIREQGVNAYDFSHDLIREVAYAMIGAPQRRQWHRRVARALETLHAEDLDSASGQLGKHYEQTGEWQTATNYYRRAAQISNARYAAEQSVFYWKKVLSISERLPGSIANIQQRVVALLEMAQVSIGINHTTSVEQKQILEHAYELAKQIQDNRQQIEALDGLVLYHGNRGDVITQYQMVLEMMRLAEEMAEDHYLCIAYGALSHAYLQRGHLPTAIENFQRFFALHKAAGVSVHKIILRRSRMTEALWLCGYPDQAHAMVHTAVRMADQDGHPFIRGFARDLTIYTLHHLDDQEALRQSVDELATLCEMFGFPTLTLTVQLFQGWLKVHDSAIQSGLVEIEQFFERSLLVDAHFHLPYFLSLLAQAYALDGQLAKAIETLERAIRIGDELGDWLWRAEILRSMGELRLRLTEKKEVAEALYQSALDLTRQQGAKSLELRAATSLARLWQSQGNHTAAYELLFPLYHWFTEGFDTADLQSAKALLDELHSQGSP
ncbi:MAG: AAA family ATPase [Caldilineaceae bacterium]